MVVTLIAGILALTANEWSAPSWLEDFGAWISILFLLLLGFANLWEVLHAERNQVIGVVGFKGRLLRRFSETSHPLVIAAVGAAFALSFDTVSQTALFALTASSLAGWTFSITLGILFMLGMMVTDGINGLWVARMLRHTDRRAVIASRVMGLSIGFLSIAIAGLGMAKYFAPVVAAMLEGASLLLGCGLLMIVLASFGLAIRLSRPVA
jgi:high-affinity nickel-transport protein